MTKGYGVFKVAYSKVRVFVKCTKVKELERKKNSYNYLGVLGLSNVWQFFFFAFDKFF